MEDIKRPISVGFTQTLLDKIDSESKSLGVSRSAFIAMAVNTYFRNQEAMSLLSQANNLFEQAQKLQNDAQINLWNEQLSITK